MAKMRKAVGGTRFVGSFVDQLPDLDLPEVAFAGRSNVGKSSCLRRLLNTKKLVRVSSTPGRTQHINLFDVGGACVFADLPGYGFAKVPEDVQDAWAEMIEAYLGNRETLRLVIVLVDARREPQASDGTLIFGLRESNIPHLVVATKADKLKKNALSKSLATLTREFVLRKGQLLPFSAVTGAGESEVWDAIEGACQ